MTAPPPPPRSRRRLFAVALLVAGLALLAAAGWLALRSAASEEAQGSGGAGEQGGEEGQGGEEAPGSGKAGEQGSGRDAEPSPTGLGSALPSTPAPLLPCAPAPLLPCASAFLPAVLSGYDGGFAALGCAQSPAGGDAATLTGELAVWQPLVLRLAGPAAGAAASDPNPFLDYRLTVRFVGPSGRGYDVPGAFDGDGRGGGAGDQWAAHFAADEPGRWRWCASFRAGPGVAVDLDPAAGAPLAFDGASGAFEVAPLEAQGSGGAGEQGGEEPAESASSYADSTATDATRSASEDADSASPLLPCPPAPLLPCSLFALGRLEYANGHYLKFRDGPYWIKTGTNSPENLLAYTGFEAATGPTGSAAPGFRHTYAAHVADWQPGDPTLPGAADAGKGIIGALNYLAEAGVNSVYFLPMNLGGDGGDTWPFLSPDDVTHYDLSKLAAWRVVFEHAQRRGIALHIVLSETEPANRAWLDGDATAGDAGILSTPRRLYYRELVARFADLPAIKWNLGEESVYSGAEAIALAGYLAALDWAGHPIALHNPAGWFGPLEDTLGRPEFSATSIQYQPDEAGVLVERWRAASAAAGRPWVVDMDENRPAQEGLTPDNAGPLRRTILYDALFSGAGGIEWYLGYHDLPVGGDLNVEDFGTRAEMWAYAAHARRFLEQNTPFWLMAPADELLTGEAADYGGGEVLALPGEVYAIYLPSAAQPATLAAPDGAYTLRWFDPRTGEFVGQPAAMTAAGGALPLGLPPGNTPGDWVALVTAAAYAPPPPAYP